MNFHFMKKLILLLLFFSYYRCLKTKARRYSFIQKSEEQISIDTECFLNGPESSESSGCFLSSPGDLADQVNKKIDDLQSTCGAVYETDEINAALNTAQKLGALKEKIVNGDKVNEKEISDLKQVLIKTFNVKETDLSNIDSKFVKAGNEGVINYIKDYCSKNNIPQFLENKYVNYLKLHEAKSYLDNFPEEQKKECLKFQEENTNTFELAYSDVNN